MIRAGDHKSYTFSAARLLLPIAVAIVALLPAVAAPTAIARPAKTSPPCASAGALVVYYVGDDWWANNTLVIRPDASATLCWWGVTNPHGRAEEHVSFVLPGPTMIALEADLGRIDVRHLGPRPSDWPPCCDRRFTALLHNGKWIPRDGRPTKRAEIRALGRAETMLDRIIERTSPIG